MSSGSTVTSGAASSGGGGRIAASPMGVATTWEPLRTGAGTVRRPIPLEQPVTMATGDMASEPTRFPLEIGRRVHEAVPLLVGDAVHHP